MSTFFKDGLYIPDFIPANDVNTFSRYPKPRRGFGARTAVIVVDMTHAFVDDKYAFGFSLTGRPCAQSIAKLLRQARQTDTPVFYTRTFDGARKVETMADPESASSKTSRELDPFANEIVGEISPTSKDVVIEKAAPSGFFGTSLQPLLNRLGVDTVIVTGMVTSGCVRATAVDAFSYRYRVIVPVECVADRSQMSHHVTLFDLSMKYTQVLPLGEVLAGIERQLPQNVAP